MTFGSINDFENANNSNANDITAPFKRFKVGDMISIVISSYPDPARTSGMVRPPEEADANVVEGTTETDTSSKYSFSLILVMIHLPKLSHLNQE